MSTKAELCKTIRGKIKLILNYNNLLQIYINYHYLNKLVEALIDTVRNYEFFADDVLQCDELFNSEVSQNG